MARTEHHKIDTINATRDSTIESIKEKQKKLILTNEFWQEPNEPI